ncbi:histone-lysine N-methyltransferase SETMAR [Trichonephila clavipes]|nr:histone-lysine N-methyltransferase SETMAR [Trichonephila clavipes]
MKFDRDGRTYRNYDSCLDIELIHNHIFDCPVIFAALEEIGVLFSSTNLYADNIAQFSRTVIWAKDPAAVTTVTRSAALGEGENATFECAAIGNPMRSDVIRWRREGFDMVHKTHEKLEWGRAYLTIVNVSRQDSGVFECVAYNGIGSEAVAKAQLIVKCIFDVKDAPRTGRPIIENADKITEIIEVDRLVSNRSIAQELSIDHKTVLSHLRKVEFRKKFHVWVPHQLTPKNMMDRISICEALAKRNEIDPFLKRMVTGDEKRVTYYNIVRKQSWSKCGEAAQTVAKPGLTARKVLLRIWWEWRGIIYLEMLPHDQTLNSDLYCQ